MGLKINGVIISLILTASVSALMVNSIGYGGELVRNKAEAESSQEPIGSAIVEPDGSYWVKVASGWESYEANGIKQGSFIGANMGRPEGVYHPGGYGREGREKIASFEDGLPAIVISDNCEKSDEASGNICGSDELADLIQGLTGILGVDDWKTKGMISDKRLDAVELYYIKNASENYRMSTNWMGSKRSNDDVASRFVLQKIDAFITQRSKRFLDSGISEEKASPMGIFVVFPLETAMFLKGLSDTVQQQLISNKKRDIPMKQFSLQGELGDENTGASVKKEEKESVDKIIQLLNRITPKEKDELSLLLESYYSRMSLPLLISEKSAEVGFWGAHYQIKMAPPGQALEQLRKR